MKSKRELTDEEATLWRRVARSVTPLKNFPKSHAIAPAKAEAMLAPPAKAAAPLKPAASPATPARKRAAPDLADRGAEKRVRRGKLDIAARLDLHGHTQEEARRALGGFLARVRADGGRVALVVTGKGGRLANGEAAPGVLKQRLPEWLASGALRPLVAGYAQAHQRHGGGGAYYVFLRAL
ncbi:MAG: Smr/MutS family protein [Hyphomonadaceae bacterium]